MKPFIDIVREGGLLVFDGAMGTQLEEKGLHPGPEWNVKDPNQVAEVHRSYADAGANVLLTNTLTANRLALERAGEADKVEDYNSTGVAVCREAAAGRAYVAGDMSSTGQMLEPYGDYTEEQFSEVFAEQAQSLARAGADLIIIETMTDLRECVVAIKSCKAATSLPVVASMCFDFGAAGPRTMMGNDVESSVKDMESAGADVIGANCGGVTPEQMAEIIAKMKQIAAVPLIAQPNAGLPELIDGKVRFNLAPEKFAFGALRCVESGARFIGGCCGTTPAHIEETARRMNSRSLT
ncbi:MAG: homocysteine S-methyltransferase family protein [Armatimonadetes bacterium]|nr:homocysteine S-methyltransferase family protein [Armatimonadota bacterium]